MRKDSGASNRRQRDTADQARDRALYRYLLKLTDLGLSGKGSLPNETSIAKQWGVEENRIFVRRVLRSVLFDELYAEKEKKPSSIPGLTLSKLVNILSALQTYQEKQQAQAGSADSKTRPVISRAEKLKALQLFAQLSAEERSQIELAPHPSEALIGQILEKATSKADPYTTADATRLYRFFLQQLSEPSSRSLANALSSAQEGSSKSTGLRGLIKAMVARHIEQYYPSLPGPTKERKIKAFVGKVRREIDRIELQSGAEQAHTFLSDESASSHHNSPSLLRLLTPEFIQRLTYSVIDNEVLTDEFPIHIKHFEIERVKPLPLYIKRHNNEKNGLLNALFLKDSKAPRSVEGLERQVAYRARVHFYIKLPDDYNIQFENLTIFKEISGQRRLEFSEEVVGVGCVTSHIIAVINRVLLWDIPSLRDYLPIADGTHCNDEVIGSTPNSPMWSHCVAKLYRREDVRKAIEQGKSCEAVATTAETASADFCGFDLLETVSKSALLARLRLVKQTLAHHPETSTSQYVGELCARVEEMSALKRAQSLLSGYPFSLRAMEGELDTTIFAGKYRERLEKTVFKQLSPNWSVVAVEAQLSIAEANLKEGLFHIAKRYLDALPDSFRNKEEHVGDLLMARYCLCMFRYYYLSDLADPACLFEDRHMAIRRAEEELEKAEDYLQKRLKHYEKLDELTQSNLNPQFYFLSRVYAHRAKLQIFFPTYMPKLDRWSMLLEPVKLLEKARIYAARDGEPSLYAQWSAYQSWCYIMLAYLAKAEDISSKSLSYSSCLDWAKRLIEHAEICYSPIGKQCYQQIKDGDGRTTEHSIDPPTESQHQKTPLKTQHILRDRPRPRYYEKYGSTMIRVIPLVQELFQNEGKKKNQRYQSDSHVVEIDLDLLKIPGKDESGSVYLFGMQSGILLFAKGVLALCKDYEDDKKLLEAIDGQAMRMFQYCCAITSDGTRRIDSKADWPNGTEENSTVLDRTLPDHNAENEAHKDDHTQKIDDDTHSRDRLLQYFYPHRLTQFADLGKIFIIVCRLILLVTHSAAHGSAYSQQALEEKGLKEINSFSGNEVKRIRALVKELRRNDSFPFDKNQTCGQKRYNGQLAKHYKHLDKYVEVFIEAFQDHRLKKMSGFYLRDLLVTDMFKIIRGEVSVMPDVRPKQQS